MMPFPVLYVALGAGAAAAAVVLYSCLVAAGRADAHTEIDDDEEALIQHRWRGLDDGEYD